MHGPDTDHVLHNALVEALGEDCVSLDASVAEAHAGDWSDAPRQRPLMTLLPRTPEDVARAACARGASTACCRAGRSNWSRGRCDAASRRSSAIAVACQRDRIV